MALESIIAQIQQGASQAERQLFDVTTDQLMAVALRYMIDEQSARDVLQEAYIRIFNSIKKFNYRSEPETWSWLQRVVVNESLRRIKKDRRWSEVQNGVKQSQVSMEVNHLYADDKFQMLKCLRREERLVFNMYAIEGYSHKEIAKELGLAESSSRSLLTRARKKLQDQLQRQESNKIIPKNHL